jgi:hypothetical protein
MYGRVWVFRKDNDTVVVKSPYADSTRLALAALRRDGSLDPKFGSQGRATIHAPWWGRDAALETTVVITRVTLPTITLVATRYGFNQLQIVRVLL